MSARTLLLLAACISSGAALRCYVCSSNDGDYCSDKELWKGQVEPQLCTSEVASGGLDLVDSIAQSLGIPDNFNNAPKPPPIRGMPVACQKIYYSKPRSRGYVERKCVLQSSTACQASGTETFLGRMDYCRTCAIDGCNSAGRVAGNVLLLLPLLALFLRYH